ncbi:MAG TPA: hypothetical protein VEK08_20185, partial [Planctomycetota bacterium]|nr:hypothetical protein [Planctomycetota bacterium]
MKASLSVILALALAVSSHAADNAPEVRAIETYVPYDEFLKIASRDSDATIMSLDEYRALVALALSRPESADAQPPLPALKCIPVEVVYTARAGETSVRFDAAFKITVTGKEWVRCDLGALQNAGRLMLDGKPGWA